MFAVDKKISPHKSECILKHGNKKLLCFFPTVVLDDAFEVVGHEVPQGSFEGCTEAVREHNGCVYYCTVDQLQARETERDVRARVSLLFQPRLNSRKS